MKATLVEELTSLAQDCNVQLARREEQVAKWVRNWGGEDDRVIRAAFRFLREAGAVKGNWPTYHEMATAIERGRADLRRREPGRSSSREEVVAQGRPISPGRLTACVIFATQHQDMSQADLERNMDRLLSEDTTDNEIAEFIRANRGVLSRPGGASDLPVSDVGQ